MTATFAGILHDIVPWTDNRGKQRVWFACEATADIPNAFYTGKDEQNKDFTKPITKGTRIGISGSGAINAALLTDVIQVIDVPGAPPDMIILLETVMKSLYRATFQETVYGGNPAGMSGLALTITGHHAGLTLEPYSRFMALYDSELGKRIIQ